MFHGKIRVGLSAKFISLTTLLIILTATALSLFFVQSKTRDSMAFLQDRGVLLARNLAYDSEYGVLTSNREILKKLLQGILDEQDVAYGVIQDAEGWILVEAGAARNFTIPERIVSGAMDCLDRGYVVQDYIPPECSVGILDVAFPVKTRRLRRKAEEIELFPGHMGILEQFRTYLKFEGQIVEESIGIARVGLTKENVLAAMADIKRTVGLITFVVICVGIFITVFLVRIIIRPIRRLVVGTRRISRGDLSHEVKVSSSDEIGDLADSFNQMTRFLQKYHSQIEEYSRTLEQKVQERTQKLQEKELELIRSEKFAAIGELITGMTHELNNKLTPILGYIQIFKTMDLGKDGARYAEVMEDSAMKAKRIVESLLKYSRPVPPKQDYIDVNETLRKTIHLVEPKIRTLGLRLELSLAKTLPRTIADDAQLGQAFLNILNNSCQAMEEMEEEGALEVSSRLQGNRIQFRISDTGPGISKNDLSKIFDPFFSTKEVGKGTGLGLSITYGIIQAHEGTIHVQSELGKGTTFLIELPVKEMDRKEPARRPAHASRAPHERGRILVVDDDESVRMVLQDALKNRHDVHLAPSAKAAMRIMAKRTFDVYFIDLRMPGISGQQLYGWIREKRSKELDKTVFITGDTFDSKTKSFLQKSGRPRLIKPFDMAKLHEIVERILGRDYEE